MAKEFQQVQWDDLLVDDCRRLVRLAIREDLGREQDWSTLSMVPENATGQVRIVARQLGVTAGQPLIDLIVEELELDVEVIHHLQDGAEFTAGDALATLRGSVRDLLTTERTILNFLGRLVGIASLTRTYVQAIEGTPAKIYDTRKTTPGWRRLEKYAVRCGGGTNHRTGLFEAVMLKDNHLAWYTESTGQSASLAELVGVVRQFLADQLGAEAASRRIVEVEVDHLAQLEAVLPGRPDIVLLDNMDASTMAQAVEIRNRLASEVQLEASGGITLSTIRAVAQSGVERISIGALTHSAINSDLGYDWT